MTTSQIFVGMDVSKAQLDIAIRPQGRFAVANNDAGVAQLMEATGGLEIPLAGALRWPGYRS